MTTPVEERLIFHITHLDNLPAILADECLWSDYEVRKTPSKSASRRNFWFIRGFRGPAFLPSESSIRAWPMRFSEYSLCRIIAQQWP